MAMLRRFGATGALALAACTVQGGDNDPFGAGSTPSTSITTVSSTTASMSETGSSETGDAGASASSDESSSSEGSAQESSSGGLAESSGGSEDGGDSTGGDPSGMQPADGMYSACTVAMDCGVVPALCITITDMMDMPLGGFCSATGCTNPALTCDASPGGTATPTCMPVEVNGDPGQACALDCSGGKTCPAPMQCRPLADAMICA